MDSDRVTRRQVLGAGVFVSGTVVAGCSELGGTEEPSETSTASPTATQQSESQSEEFAPWDLAAKVSGWAWYPEDPALWSRSEDPYDVQTAGGRWLAEPTSEGSVRCRVEGDAPPGNAGFYVDLGPLNEIGRITIETETVQSDVEGDQRLAVALYVDGNDDGDYFAWTSKGDQEAFAGMGGDVEALGLLAARDEVTIAVDRELDLVPPKEPKPITIGDLRRGSITDVDPLSRVALQVGVLGGGADTVEELIVHRISSSVVERVVSELDWPMAYYDYRNQGLTPAEGPTAPVEPRWAFETDGAVRSSPAVVDDTVYVGSDDGYLYAIDAETGSEVWSFETGGPVVSSPAFLRHVVYVGSDDGRLYALSAEAGEEIWTYETNYRIRSSPTVQASGVPAGIESLLGFGGDDGGVYLLDPATGEEVKSLDTDHAIVSTPMFMYNEYGKWEMGVGSTDPRGREYWWIPDEREGYGDSFTVLETESPNYASLSHPQDGTNTWYRAAEDGTFTEMADSRTRPEWTFEGADDAIRTTPVSSRSVVYFGSWDGSLYALNRASGEKKWAHEVGAKINSTPAVTAGTLYFGSDDGHVYALDAQTGERVWSFGTGEKVVSSPAVTDGTVYVGSNDGSVYALAGSNE